MVSTPQVDVQRRRLVDTIARFFSMSGLAVISVYLVVAHMNTMEAQPLRGGAGANNDIKFETTHTKEEHRKQKETKQSEWKHQQLLQKYPPGIVHLMSFPNSGTTYTLSSIQKATRDCTASHASNISFKPGEIAPNSGNIGPYYHCELDSWLPDKYVLSKTHCQSFCKQCHTHMVATRDTIQETFQEGCHVSETYNYDLNLVKKNVHLVRNPFDNVVARFHSSFKKDNSDGFSDLYEKTYEGFNEYCAWHNEIYSSEHTSVFLLPEHKELASKVPCLGEFFKYIAWHNMANTMIEKMGVPSVMLHYEDYNENFEETFSGLVSFLETEQVSEPIPFFWHDYPDYFEDDAMDAAVILMKSWASDETWDLIRRYVDSDSISDAS